jgi:hypothetical protein
MLKRKFTNGDCEAGDCEAGDFGTSDEFPKKMKMNGFEDEIADGMSDTIDNEICTESGESDSSSSLSNSEIVMELETDAKSHLGFGTEDKIKKIGKLFESTAELTLRSVGNEFGDKIIITLGFDGTCVLVDSPTSLNTKISYGRWTGKWCVRDNNHVVVIFEKNHSSFAHHFRILACVFSTKELFEYQSDQKTNPRVETHIRLCSMTNL